MSPTAETKSKRTVSIAMLAALLAMWASFFWPVPKYLSSAIPYVQHRADNAEHTILVPGDHLQLLYHFWLTKSALTGKTPLFRNIYEFNRGNDDELVNPDPGYLPFSLAYSVFSIGGNDALGWNVAQFCALACAFFLLFALASRYTSGKAGAFLSAMLAMCFPYQWTTLSAGSPTGFGMAIVPAVILGIDIAVRDFKVRGGVLAGLAIFFCYTSDLHCFFFAMLFAPAWAMFAAATGLRNDGRPARDRVMGWIRALWPTAVSAGMAMMIAKFLKSMYSSTDAAGGRPLSQLIPHSPSPHAFIERMEGGSNVHFYCGIDIFMAVILTAITAAVLLACAGKFRRRERDRKPHVDAAGESGQLHLNDSVWAIAARVALLLAAMTFVVCLAAGTNCPGEALPIRAARKLIPPYRMIRQPVKIFVLMPSLLAVVFATGSNALRKLASLNNDRIRVACYTIGCIAVALCAKAFAGTSDFFRIGLSSLPRLHPAYSALISEARTRGETPHVVAIPIWPGDSAWSSLYEYAAMKGRVRMLNGYSAVRSNDYAEKVFKRYESINQGHLDRSQVRELNGMGITSMVFHKNAFPDQVSPFPAAFTLRRLLENPFLEEIAQSGSAWAFRLKDQDAAASDATAGDAPPPDDPSPGFPIPVARWWRSPRPDGNGRFSVATRGPVWTGIPLSFAVRHDNEWTEIPLASFSDGEIARLDIPEELAPPQDVLLVRRGDVDGILSMPEVEWPANWMFRSGTAPWSDEHPGSVFFSPLTDLAKEVLYGPNLPLGNGRWRVSIPGEYSGEADMRLRVLVGNNEAANALIGAKNDSVEFDVKDNGVVTFRLHYFVKNHVRVDSLIATKLD